MAELTAQLNIDTAQFTQGVTKAIQESKTLSDQLLKLSKSGGLDQATKGTVELDKGLDKATLSAKALTNQLDKVGKEAQNAGSKAKQGLGSFADAITGGLVGGGVAVLGSQLASLASSAFTAVIEKGGQFEQTLSAVGAIVGQSGKPLDVLGEKARELGVKFGTDATDQLSAFQTILSKVGPQVADSAPALQKFTDAANILGKAGGIDAATATNNLVDAMLQLGLVTGDANKDAENAVFLTNQLAKSAQVGAAEIPQVAQSLLQVGASSKLLNQSTDATIAAIQALALGGKTGSEAGIAYRNVLGLMVKSSGEGDKAFARLGTSTQELGKLLTDAKSPTEALKKLKTGLAGVSSESEKAALLSKIFGAENSAAAAILIENVDKIAEFQTGIQDAQKGTGSAFEQAKQQMETFQQVAKTAQATLSDIAISTFQEFQSVLGSVFTGDSIDFSAIASGFKDFIGVVGEILRPLLEYWKVLFDIASISTKNVIFLFQSIASEFSSIFAGSKESSVSFGEAIQSVFKAVGSAVETSVTIMQTGIKLLVTIFGSALEPLVKPFLATGNESQTLAEKIKAFADGVNVQMQNVTKYFQGLQEYITLWRGRLVSVFDEFYNAIKQIFNAIGSVVGGIASVFKAVFDSIVAGVNFVLTPLRNLISTIQSWTGATNQAKVATQQNNQVAGQSPSIFQRIGQAVQVAGGILGFFRATLAGVGAFFESFAKTVNEGFALIASGNVVDGFKRLTDVFSDATAAFAQGFEDTVKKNQEELKQQTKTAEEEAQKQTEAAKESNKNIQQENNKTTKTTSKNAKESTKKQETELSKALKQYKFFNEKITEYGSDYYNELQEIERDFSLTEQQRRDRRTALELKANQERAKLLQKIFNDGVKVPFNLAKDENLQEVKGLFDDVNKEREKFETDALKISFEANEKRRKESLESAVKLANEVEKLKVGEQLTTSIIQALGLEGVKVGDKLTEKNFEFAQNVARQALFNALQELDFTISKTQNPETKQALEEQRKKIQDDLDKLGFGIKLEVDEERDVFKEISNSFVDAFGKLSFDFNIDTSESQKAIDDVKKSIADLDKQLAKGEVTGEEYQRAIGELKKAEAEALKGIPSLTESLLKQTVPAFTQVANEGKTKLQEINKQFRENEDFVMNWGQVTGLAVQTAVGAFAQYREQTGSTLKAVVLAAIDALNALVPIITAQIFGLYASSTNAANVGTLGIVGAAAATLVTSAFLALVKSAVAGFETGGLVKGGEQLIRINEKGQEFVNNASSTRRNMPILEALNKGNDRRAFELMNERFGMTVSGGSQVVNLQELTAIKTELQMLRKERVLSRTKIEMNDVNLKANGRDLVGISNAVQSFKNKRR